MSRQSVEEESSGISRRNFLRAIGTAGVLAGGGLALAGSIPSVGAPSTFDWQSATYIVYIDSSGIVNARNGTTGVVDYSGTDAATVIQSALNALTVGGLVTLREGIYLITRTILIPSSTTLMGAGFGTILKLANGANVDVAQNIDQTNGNTKIRVVGLRIDGNKANQTAAGKGIYLNKCTDSLIDSVITENCRDRGFYYKSCSSSQIRNCVARSCGVYQEQGFNLESSSFCEVANCFAEACTDLNFIIAFGDHCRVSNCISKNTSTGSGIEIYGGEYPSPIDTAYHEVLGFIHDGGSGGAIGVNKARNILIDGFTITNSPGGVFVQYAESHDVLISNGYIYNPSSQGVLVQNGSRDVLITNVYIYNPSSNAVLVQSASDVMVANGYIYNPSTNAILVQNAAQRVHIRNMIVDQPSGQYVRGIYAVDWSGQRVVTDITVQGCSVKNGSEIGIRFENVSRFVCLGNYVRGCGSAGIHIMNSTEGMISDNHSNGNAYGISEQGTSDQNLFLGNHVRNNSLGAMTILSSKHGFNVGFDI